MTEREALSALRGDDRAEAAKAAAVLWDMWHHSGDGELDRMLRRGIELMEGKDLVAAEELFTKMTATRPAFAEGWNKRATVRFLAKDYDGAIADCRETLARNPNHFGALSGQGLCHMALGQHREAADCFRRTLVVHPHLENARQNLRAALAEVVKWN